MADTKAQSALNSTDADRGPFLFVWAVWLSMAGGVFAFVLHHGGRHLPHLDEWPHIGESFTLPWLWAQYHEHRLPLAKLVWLGMLKLTDYDFRAGMLLEVLCLSVMSAAMLVVVRRIRGRTTYSDAFFPLALLSFGQAMTYLWWWQFNSLLAPLAANTFLLIVIRHGCRPALRHVVAAGICLVLLPFCGPGGLPYAVLLPPWFFYHAWRQWGSTEPDRRRNSLVAFGFAVLALGFVGLYFTGWTISESVAKRFEQQSPVEWHDIRDAALAILGLSLGTATFNLWEHLGTESTWKYWGAGVLVLGLLTAGLITGAWYRQPQERLRAAGLLLILLTEAGLTYQLAQSRAVLGVYYIFTFSHYLGMLVPALCCIYFAWELYGPARLRSLVPMCLFAVLVLLFAKNLENALRIGAGQRQGDETFVAEVHSGLPLSFLVERVIGGVPEVYSVDEAEGFFLRARENGAGIFRHVAPNPPWIAERLGAQPAELHRAEWLDGVVVGASTEGDPAVLKYILSGPRRIHAIRFRFSIAQTDAENKNDLAQFTLRFQGRSETRTVSTNREGNRCTFLIDDIIDHFELMPDVQPFELRLREVELLILEADRPVTAAARSGPRRSPGDASPGEWRERTAARRPDNRRWASRSGRAAARRR